MVMNEIAESIRFQKEIRSQSVLVPSDFTGGTLDTSFLRNTVGNRVFADSYGPFNVNEYFAPGTYRIMFLLKESYLGAAEEEKGLSEGHSKADEYYTTEWGDMEPTYHNIAKMAFSLIVDKRYTNSEDNKDKALSYMRNHVCVVNANFYPCVGGKYSCDKRIYDWAQVNYSKIQKLFDLYHPNIVIGGHTLTHFIRDVQNGSVCKILGEEVNILGHKEIKSMLNIKSWNYDSYYNNNILMINTKHPSIYDSSELILAIRNWWIKNKTT